MLLAVLTGKIWNILAKFEIDQLLIFFFCLWSYSRSGRAGSKPKKKIVLWWTMECGNAKKLQNKAFKMLRRT